MDFFEVVSAAVEQHLATFLFLVVYLGHGIDKLSIVAHATININFAVDFEAAGINTTGNRPFAKLNIIDLFFLMWIVNYNIVHDQSLVCLLVLIARSLPTKHHEVLVSIIVEGDVAHPSNCNVICLPASVVFQGFFFNADPMEKCEVTQPEIELVSHESTLINGAVKAGFEQLSSFAQENLDSILVETLLIVYKLIIALLQDLFNFGISFCLKVSIFHFLVYLILDQFSLVIFDVLLDFVESFEISLGMRDQEMFLLARPTCGTIGGVTVLIFKRGVKLIVIKLPKLMINFLDAGNIFQSFDDFLLLFLLLVFLNSFGACFDLEIEIQLLGFDQFLLLNKHFALLFISRSRRVLFLPFFCVGGASRTLHLRLTFSKFA